MSRLRRLAKASGVGIATTTAALYAVSRKPTQLATCPDELMRCGKQVAADIGQRRDLTEWDCCEMVVKAPPAAHYDALALTQGLFGGRVFAPQMRIMKAVTHASAHDVVWQPLSAARSQWKEGSHIADAFEVHRITATDDAFVERVEVKHIMSFMHATLTLDAHRTGDSVRYRLACSSVDPRSEAALPSVGQFLHRVYARALLQDAVRQLPLSQ